MKKALRKVGEIIINTIVIVGILMAFFGFVIEVGGRL